jgi:hypothetical protein
MCCKRLMTAGNGVKGVLLLLFATAICRGSAQSGVAPLDPSKRPTHPSNRERAGNCGFTPVGRPLKPHPTLATAGAGGDSFRNIPDASFRALPDCNPFPLRLILKCRARAGSERTGRSGDEDPALAQAPAALGQSKGFQCSGLQSAATSISWFAPKVTQKSRMEKDWSSRM